MPCLSKVQVKLTDYEAALEAALEVFGEKNVYTLTDKWLGDDIYIAAVINGKRESIYLSRRKVKGAFEKNLYTSAKTAGEMQIVAKVSQVYA